MTSTRTKVLSIFAPAKINLYLHVTGRLDNGYHTLDSLVAFADIGDEIKIEPASDFDFIVQGPYANGFSPKELDASPNSSNLVVQAVWALSRAAQKPPNVKITLTKNLPLASGIGGGSSDAGSVLWGLLEWWGISKQAQYLPALMATLGADVPVCLTCAPARMRGIGEILDPAPHMPEIPVVLLHPRKSCPTAQVFARYRSPFREPSALPDAFDNVDQLATFLKTKHNDLYAPACEIVPEVLNAVHTLESRAGCRLGRMSGAGATCFGLFASEEQAQAAARDISFENPDWWVQSGWLNRPERY